MKYTSRAYFTKNIVPTRAVNGEFWSFGGIFSAGGNFSTYIGVLSLCLNAPITPSFIASAVTSKFRGSFAHHCRYGSLDPPPSFPPPC